MRPESGFDVHLTTYLLRYFCNTAQHAMGTSRPLTAIAQVWLRIHFLASSGTVT